MIINDLAAAYAAYAGTGRSVTDEDRAPDWRTFGDIAEREREYERDRAKNAKSAKDARNTTKIDGGAFATTVADALPLPPALPAPGNGGGADGVSRSVTRHSGVLGIPQWERLGRIAEAAGASRPGLLLAIYRHALGLWDPAERLSIVMPGMDKRATPDDVLDRTRAWITRCATSPGITLGKAARGATEEVRRRIRASLDSDDELRRARSRGDDHPGILPVVLTCGSEEVLLSPEVRDVFGQLAYTGSVTPQVLCDLQVLRLTADEVRVALDVRDGAYADTVGEELFSAFFGALRSLAEAAPDTDAAALAALPLDDVVRVAGDTAARRRALNGTAAAPDALLHAPFLERVEQTPDATALIDPGNGEPLTYAELHRAALALADELADAVQPGDLVGIRLPKGRDQITAVLAVLYLGAAYLPIGAHAPQRRVDAICKAAAPVAIIDGVDGSVYERLTTDPPRHASLPRTVAPTDRAYVIFTSGSTGTPKGVVMSHAAASNTILAVRAQHGLGAEDRVLAVSELDFDLSVFDIFGLLGAGGAIVCIADDQRRDAFAWADLVRRYGVTVWNSAPALAEMLVLVGGDPLPLRTVLVSGDWVSLSLPERLRAVARADGDRGVRLVAMGGATEAGIWSNQHIIDSPADLPPDWPSIPYGHPLPGQAYRVVDERGRDCPTGVVGELWIGGRSLADGYLGREELTRERFVTVDDRSGQDDGPTHRRWYRTGDHGYWARTEHRGETADLMFFVGRRDNQVKIRGHRVELGDVEHHLRKIPGVDVAVVLPEPGNRALLALVSPEPGAVLDGGALRVALAGEVPEFMVPRKITVSSSMVLTANGKIDRAWAAEKLADDGADDAGAAAAPNDGAVDATGAGDSVHAATGDATAEIEAAVRRAWRAVLDEPWLDRIGDDPNFFALGGDSVGATEACARLRAEGMPVSAADLFANPRLNHFVEVCAKKTAADGGAYVSSGSAARGDSRPEGHAEDPAEDPANDGQPFPLLPLQRAYALGVDGIVGTVRSRTVYATILRRGGGSERAGGPAVEKRGFSRDEVTEVGRRIVGSCPALRVVRVDDDTQRVVDAERAFTVTVVGDAAGAAGLRGLLEDRDPATPIEFILPREGSAELGILIDYIALDGRSLAEIVGALAAAFSGRDHALSGSIARFAAYCRDRAQVALGAVAPAAQESAGSMPQPPVLPVQRLPRHSTGFRSFRAAVPAHVLARRAENHGVTASAYLLAEYGAVLAEASGIGEVGIVVPFGHRPEEVTGERCELGLFTHLGVCRCAATPDHAEIQRQLAAQVDGDGAPARVSSGRTGRYPAVFTSVIGYDGVATDFGDVLPVWSLTRTPGVLIDCQVTTEGEDGDRIGIRWDIPKKVLDEQRISAMFSRFADAVGAEVAPASAASSAPRRERGSARRTVTELLREVTGIIDAGAADEDRMLAWARPVVAAWRRFVELGPEGTGLEDAAIAWTARDARYLADVVRGRARRFSVLEHPRLSPRALALADPMVGQALSVFERRLNESPASTVVELGYAADPSRIGDDRTWIVVEPDERIADIATVDGRTCVGGVGDLRSPVDLVLACGTLHRDPRLAEALRRVPLAPGAEIHLIEAERLTAASLVSAAVVDPSILDGDPT
ncbi:amino acid adenylation domain-containing protein, partial [Corynebacterium propinquum]